MSSRINCILLVDDDEPTNMFHRIVLENTGVSKVIKVAETGFQALRLLQDPQDITCQDPDIIFLDLNMPGMNGWEFIDNYRKLRIQGTAPSKIFILTTSSDDDDIKRAEGIKEIQGFRSKPLTEEMIQEIIDQYFPPGEVA
ncbi:MAG: response regulator [Flavobacteriales bacterium]|nr:response regulator [Flavobacteriales bacterium]MCB9447231.1 response regulator [Flavobacteriales bacterium]